MASRWATAAVILLIGAGLGGCGNGDSPSTSSAVTAAVSIVPTDLARATSGDTNLDGAADAGKAMTADDLCGFLADETPKVIDLKPAEYAYATFGGALLTFYSGKGLLTDIDGADIDALAAKGCPEKAATLLPVLGASSFEKLLSQ
ncbi:hypothetical protein [Humibacillus sp. DSM 29435]|uniref:hypothetical protein n=1 Tax=Humibacillus sp. DSM 29435 TaxID=1869167 RepID=UPI00111310C5|nr:hypothetical protein [Humibacillus sp. DSM 29435]